MDHGGWVTTLCERLPVALPGAREAITDAMEVTSRYTAPFVTRAVVEMLPDLRAEVAKDPSTKIVFVGRDGYSMGNIAKTLDPQLCDDHGIDVVLSRKLVEAAMLDFERITGQEIDLPGFREKASDVRPQDIPGAFRRLQKYLQSSGIVGPESGNVILVDTSHQGSIQEMLKALFPDIKFKGCYLFHGQSPKDPHPGTKKGYGLNLLVGKQVIPQPVGNLTIPEVDVFKDPAVVRMVEETLHGRLGSPGRIEGNRPVQAREELMHPSFASLDLPPAYWHQDVRNLIQDATLLSLNGYAGTVAGLRDGRANWKAYVDEGAERFVHAAISWVRGIDVDPQFTRFMNAHVRRKYQPEPGEWVDWMENAPTRWYGRSQNPPGRPLNAVSGAGRRPSTRRGGIR